MISIDLGELLAYFYFTLLLSPLIILLACYLLLLLLLNTFSHTIAIFVHVFSIRFFYLPLLRLLSLTVVYVSDDGVCISSTRNSA